MAVRTTAWISHVNVCCCVTSGFLRGRACLRRSSCRGVAALRVLRQRNIFCRSRDIESRSPFSGKSCQGQKIVFRCIYAVFKLERCRPPCLIEMWPGAVMRVKTQVPHNSRPRPGPVITTGSGKDQFGFCIGSGKHRRTTHQLVTILLNRTCKLGKGPIEK